MSPAPATQDAPRHGVLAGGGVPLLALLALAAGLRLFRINDQLWIDEFSALDAIRRPAWLVMTEWPGWASHIFFEILASLSLSVLGESPFSIRLPAAVFGVVGVWLVYRLVVRWFERRTALVVTALFTVSYHHIQFSQNARGYTTLMAFFLLTTLFLDIMRVERRARPPVIVGYAASAALTAYSQMFGAFVAAGHLVAGVATSVIARVRGRSLDFPLFGLLGAVSLAGLLTLLAYLPLIGGIFQFAETSVADPGEGPRAGAGVLFEIIEGLQAAFLGPVGLAIAVAIGVVGLTTWLRAQPFITASFVAPLVVELLVFAAMGAGIHPRYFAIALPVIFLIGGVGVVVLVTGVVERLPIGPVAARRLGNGVLVALVVMSALPLIDYYSMPKQDYLGAIEVVNASAAPGDVRVAVHLANPVNLYYQSGFEDVMTMDELARIEAAGQRVWLITTLERLLRIQDEELYRHIQSNYERVAELPGSVGDGSMRIYMR